MLKKAISALFLSVVFLCNVSAVHTVEIVNKSGSEYKSIRLTPEIYKYAKSDLSDLLIKDETGAIVPYFIYNDYIETQNIVESSAQLEIIDDFVKDDDSYYDFKAETEENVDILATSIDFTIDSYNFAKEVQLLGSFDGLNWDFITSETLYYVDGNSKLDIDFGEPLKFTHYRLKIINNIEKIVPVQGSLRYSDVDVSRNYFTASHDVEFEVQTEAGEDTMTLSLLNVKNLTLSAIEIETDSQFSRVFDVLGSTQHLFNFEVDGVQYSDLKIPLNNIKSTSDTMQIVIHNNDDVPIDISGIKVYYLADDLVFLGEDAKTFTLEFGNPNAEKPYYDIVNYQDIILKTQIQPLEISNTRINQTVADGGDPPKDYSVVFNWVIIAVSVVLGYVIVSKLIAKPKKK